MVEADEYILCKQFAKQSLKQCTEYYAHLPSIMDTNTTVYRSTTPVMGMNDFFQFVSNKWSNVRH